MKTIEVEVTLDDIHDGFPGNETSCPVARAVSRLIWGDVEVCFDGLFVDGIAIDLPSRISEWIMDYDAGRPVQPTSFTIEVPDDA